MAIESHIVLFIIYYMANSAIMHKGLCVKHANSKSKIFTFIFLTDYQVNNVDF